MDRTVISEKDVAEALVRARGKLGPEESATALAPAIPSADSYADRLVKYIPPEVVAGFSAIEGLVDSAKPVNSYLAWAVFVVILFATPVYLVKVGNVRKPSQVGISTVAFIIWAIAYPGPPFVSIVNRLSAAVLLGLYVFLIPLFVVK
jgi:hypothetical protein